MKNIKANVEDRPDLVRDLNSKAILSIDKEKLSEYKNKKIQNEKNYIYNKELNNIKQEIFELKKLMLNFINGDNNEKSKNE